MKYEDLMSLDLKEYEVPISLSEKLWQLASPGAGDYWVQVRTLGLLECAQHAKVLEDLVNKKEAENAQESSDHSPGDCAA